MLDVVVIVGDHGPLWVHFPVVGHCAGSIMLFLDHRMRPRERAAALHQCCPLDEIGSLERVVADPIPPEGCACGAHDWSPVEFGCLMVGGRCRRCRRVEMLDVPLPAYNQQVALAN